MYVQAHMIRYQLTMTYLTQFSKHRRRRLSILFVEHQLRLRSVQNGMLHQTTAL